MSNEWLTTGQMIDKLQIGQAAEGSTYWEVKLVEPGVLVELNSGSNVVMSRDFLLEKWRIIPNYVSFEEAMKALKEGKAVTYRGVSDEFNINDIVYPKEANHRIEATELRSHGIFELYKGRWTIEADTQ